VGVPFYAFFADKNGNSELLMEATTWWIKTHKLNHFVKVSTLLKMVKNEIKKIGKLQ